MRWYRFDPFPPLRGKVRMGGAVNRVMARALRNHPTDTERALWRHLRQRQFKGLKFRRQQPIGSYIVDFVCLERKLILEVDGGQHAASAQDLGRTTWLVAFL